MFAGTLGTRIRLLAARDPESKGVIERNNGFFETSFLPGRTFSGPEDFNTQMAGWLPRANTRLVRATGARPVDAVGVDLAAMTALPPLAPMVGLANRVRLARDYYVRVDTNDYSVDPRVIGRLVDVSATPTRVNVTCDGMVVAAHERCWAHRIVVSDPAHVATAKGLRAAFSADRAARERAARHGGNRHHDDGTTVMLRALPDYDALYGVDFTPAPTPTTLDAVTGLVSPTVEVPTTGTVAACEPGIVLDPVPRTVAVPEPATVAVPEPGIVLGPAASNDSVALQVNR